MARPERIKSIRLFEDDRRVDGGKFLFLNVPVQPIAVMGTDGTLIRPGMIEDESVVSAGNAGVAAFPDAFDEGQVWVLDHFGVFNGGPAAKLMGCSIIYLGINHMIGSDPAVGIAAPQEMLSQPFYFDEQIGAQILVGGAALDEYTLHARRIA